MWLPVRAKFIRLRYVGPNSITVILFTTAYQSLRLSAFNRLGTLLPALLLNLLNPVISLRFYALHWLKITERIEYKLTYKVLITVQPPYLHNLISVEPLRNTRSSSLVTLVRSPTSSSLRIADSSFRYASPCLWN